MNNTHPLITHVKRRLGPLLNIAAVNAMRGVPMPDVSGEAAQIAIARMITEGGRLVARVGETEGRAAAWRLRERLARLDAPPYEPLNRERLKLLAGYFPTTDQGIDQLADLYLSAIAQIDMYAAWTPHDKLLCPSRALKCRLIDIDPFFTHARWPRALADKRVTVVSPFKKTILAQWQKRKDIFAKETMPACNLVVVRAPQTQCETDVAGQNWFANLKLLDEQIEETRPDVVVIGAGAYGLPLGAMAVKRGASAIVMGGSTQLLFGIMGNRWLIDPAYARLQNDAWTRPSEQERPSGFQNFETAGGAYW